MKERIVSFVHYQREQGKKSQNTLDAYRRDLNSFAKFMETKGKLKVEEVTATDVISYVMKLKEDGKVSNTVNRHGATLRNFFTFMVDSKIIDENPAKDLKGTATEKKELVFLTIEEATKLIEAASNDDPSSLRDRAILEVLYGTGVRVSELLEFTLADLNLSMGILHCNGNHGKERIVPLGSYCKEALMKYMDYGRPHFIEGKAATDTNSPLFPNRSGVAFTRQGIWNIVAGYGNKVGIKDKATPQILRTSFAVHMIQNGADLKTLQELLGHDDMQSMEIYMELIKNRIKDVYNRTHPRA